MNRIARFLMIVLILYFMVAIFGWQFIIGLLIGTIVGTLGILIAIIVADDKPR